MEVLEVLASVSLTLVRIFTEVLLHLNENGLKFAYQLLTGLKYNLSGSHNLTGAYKYCSVGGVETFDDIKSHNLEIGYRLDL